MSTIVFFSAISLFFYTYFVYPFLLFLLALLKPKKLFLTLRTNETIPSVSLIITAYNEENDIERKIKNSLNLDYPKEKIEIIVVSDGSKDNTDDIVSNYSQKGIKLISLSKRGGKTAAQNFAVKNANSEILIFSDATSIYEKDAIKQIVKNFSDPLVGCVGGKLIFLNSAHSNHALLESKSAFNMYEQFVKRYESIVFTTFGVDGCIYAIRSCLYEPLEEFLTSDFVLPLRVIKKGFRTIFEENAKCYEETPQDTKAEFNRKTRTVKAGLVGFFNMTNFLIMSNKKKFVSFGLISHKLLRWLTPFMLISVFISNFVLGFYQNTFFIFFMLQVVFYSLAAIGFFTSMRKFKVVNLAFNFCLYSVSALVGFIKFIKEKPNEIWETQR